MALIIPTMAGHGMSRCASIVKPFSPWMKSISAVLDYLKESGLDENTLVIYMGDNGFAWGEHGLIDKRQFYEESVRVPMLVRCPGILKGGTVIESASRILTLPRRYPGIRRIEPCQTDGGLFLSSPTERGGHTLAQTDFL